MPAAAVTNAILVFMLGGIPAFVLYLRMNLTSRARRWCYGTLAIAMAAMPVAIVTIGLANPSPMPPQSIPAPALRFARHGVVALACAQMALAAVALLVARFDALERGCHSFANTALVVFALIVWTFLSMIPAGMALSGASL